MKFIKGKLSLLYPLFLLLFYFYVRPQFRPLAQYVSTSLASANSYYWTLFGLEGLYATFAGFLVYRFSKKAQFKLGKNPLQSLMEAIFAACLVYWLDYFISGFVQGRAAVLSLFPREISPTGMLILVIAMVVIRPVTEELIFRGALVNAYFKGWKLYAEIWLPALIYSGLHFLHT
ncbi:MAG: CPBP family intramembrane glutamic endopeptidase, partial [Streptococcus parasanguinis]|nr:CPBP family intramembrane glutamic endopeptidase [Streptococcus parasanguinis]